MSPKDSRLLQIKNPAPQEGIVVQEENKHTMRKLIHEDKTLFFIKSKKYPNYCT
jgi:hypothetical protein